MPQQARKSLEKVGSCGKDEQGTPEGLEASGDRPGGENKTSSVLGVRALLLNPVLIHAN